MSNQTPNRVPFAPLHPRVPELMRDSEGNVLYREPDGSWRHHNGPLPQSLLGQRPDQAPEPVHRFGASALIDSSHGAPSSPIEHAFNQDQYQFALQPVGAGTAQHAIPIDPALITLPGGADLDLRDPATIARARGLKPADKVAGSRRKGKERASDPKGKKRQRASSVSEDESEPQRKRGRPTGSGNYHKEDTAKLFDLIEEELPVGQKGWKVIHRRFNKWAVLHGRTKRSPKSLENKYKTYLKAKKPTGSASCPPEVKRAHEREDLINERVGTRDLSDSEFDDNSDAASSDDDVEVLEHGATSVRTAVARRAPTPPLRRNARATGADLANKLAHALDPDVQKARDDSRAQRTFENTQILTLTQQLRDAQAVTEGLRSQLTILQNHVHDLERARDRAEMRLEVLQMSNSGDGTRGRSRRRNRALRSHKRDTGIQRVGKKIRCETLYPEGGAMTYWVSDPSTDDEFEDENENPYWDTFDMRSRSRSHRATSRRPLSRRRTPTPGPSRLPRLSPTRFSPRPAMNTAAESTRPLPSAVTGNAVELVVTPDHGPAMSLLISPSKNQSSGL
ncbi:hypothetical protein B0H11DRAFT_2255560 [Mycena galericulata]|nr:hypothetical protein B0H11DRAFT_2255560 [Mycena galericulata]